MSRRAFVHGGFSQTEVPQAILLGLRLGLLSGRSFIREGFYPGELMTPIDFLVQELDFREPNEPWFKNHLKSI